MADKELKEPKIRKIKTPALEPEEFAREVEATHSEFLKIANYYSGVTKHKFKAGDSTPSRIEFNSVGKMLDSLIKPYAKLFKKPKRKVVRKPDAKKSDGFKQKRFLKAHAVTFVNDHCNLPEALKLEPLADLGGDAVFSFAQATQALLGRVEEKHLKDPHEKTRITFDGPFNALFAPLIDTIDRKKWIKTAEGNIVLDHKTLQSLIPKLFEKHIPVIPKYVTDETKRRIAERETLLGLRTNANQDAREVARKAEKDAEIAKRPAKAPKK